VLGWITGRSRREAELAAQLEEKDHQLASLKAAGEAILASTPSNGVPFGQPSMAGAAEQLNAFRGWPFVAASAIAKRTAAQPITLSRIARRRSVRGTRNAQQSSLEPIETHPLLDLLSDPNPLGTAWTFKYATVANLLMSGRAFWHLFESGDEPPQLFWLPSSWVVGFEMNGNAYAAWKVLPPGRTEPILVPAEEMTSYFYLPDPANPQGAISPLQACAPAVVADRELTRSQMAGFRTGVFPRMAVHIARETDAEGKPTKSRAKLTGTQRQQLLDSIRALYGGAINSNEPWIVDGLIDSVEKLSHNPSEMDWLDSSKSLKERILQSFGVNEAIVGQLEGANRASATAAEMHFVHTAVNPIAQLMSEAMTEWLARHELFASESERLVLQIEPAVAKDEELELKKLQLLANVGAITGNELRAALCGLPPLDFLDEPIAVADGLGDSIRSLVDDRLAAIGGREVFKAPRINGHAVRSN
jgi:phage portal protein BeeE